MRLNPKKSSKRSRDLFVVVLAGPNIGEQRHDLTLIHCQSKEARQFDWPPKFVLSWKRDAQASQQRL
jgi:hypothetical protein